MDVYKGNIVDVLQQNIYPGEIHVENGIIKNLIKSDEKFNNYLLPGLVDSHVHIESSMVSPPEFAKACISHGSIGAVCDPHEIANVLGVNGVTYMVEESKKVPFKFYFGVPSCVPATPFETSGGKIEYNDIEKLFEYDNIINLGEMMNFPGVINEDSNVINKLNIAKRYNRPIDGHAPGLSGEDLKKYINFGISTDHETSNFKEAEEKINKGMIIQIREGSAAKNFEALWELIDKYPDYVMLCCDDIHPDDLYNYHINNIVKNALSKGLDLFKILKTAIINPVRHYNLDVGLLQPNDKADFIEVEDLNNFQVTKTIINGNLVYSQNRFTFNDIYSEPINNFERTNYDSSDLKVNDKGDIINVIEAYNKEIFTKKSNAKPNKYNGYITSDIKNDILKIIVASRYSNEIPQVGFIKNFNLKRGAFGSTIAHDSHNIIAVGTSDSNLEIVLNQLIENRGGLCAYDEEQIYSFPLDIAGLMSSQNIKTVAHNYHKLNEVVKDTGCNFDSPFMTLSFMALLVIPEIKLSDKGLFDVNTFSFISLFE